MFIVKMFEYVCSVVQIRFGTLSEYFDALRHYSGGSSAQQVAVPPGFPSLSGDFYTYSDRSVPLLPAGWCV